MRAGRRRRGRRERITLELASMIDVTFLLLIYFMVTVVIAPPEDRLTPTLQTQRKQSAGANIDFQPQIVEVVNTGTGPRYRIGSQVFAGRAELEPVLAALPKSTGLFVHVHDQVPVGFAVAAMQVARDAGFDQVTYVPAE